MASPPKPLLDPEGHAAFMVVALANRISSGASRAYMRRFGIGVMEWRVLAMVAREPGVTANQVGQISGVDKSSVIRAAQSLIRRGDLTATEDTADNRRSFLNLTPQGQALHDRMILASLERESQLMDGLSETERSALFALLRRMTANMVRLQAGSAEEGEAAFDEELKKLAKPSVRQPKSGKPK